MKQFWSFVKKESLEIIRDKRTLLVVIAMPTVMILIFGFAISIELNNLDFVAVTPEPTREQEQIVNEIANDPYFTFKGYVSGQDVYGTLRRGDAVVAVVFDKDFDRKMAGVNPSGQAPLQVLFDASNPNTATQGLSYLGSMLAGRLGTYTPDTHILYNPQLKSAYNFVPGIMGLVFILICAQMTAVSIVREKETGTMEVLLMSPVRTTTIVASKMIPYFVLCAINLLAILLISRYILGVPLAGSLWAINGISLLYIVMSLALGMFISTIAKDQVTAIIIAAVGLLVPILMLSGMIFPVENMPEWLQWVSTIVPARWYIDAMRRLMVQGVAFNTVIQDVVILSAMTVFFIVVALKKFNNRLS